LFDEANTVAIGILYIHFSGTPGLVNRSRVNSDALCDEFRVDSIHALNIRLTTPPEIPSPENEETCSRTPSRIKPM
jgi:stress-induced morphogen